MTRAGWWRELALAGVALVLAGLLGWWLGQLWWPLLAAVAAVLGGWLYQLWRVADWLRRPGREPPEARGIWGELFDGIYQLQRREQLERDRLQTAVSYLRDSFAALKNATVLVAPDGTIEWCNEAAGPLLGLQYPRDRGQALLNLVRLPAFHSYFTGADYQQPLQLDSPATVTVVLLIEITPFGRGSRLLFARDITREQRLEGMRRDFIANVSHELRTPLTVISGYLQTLLESGHSREPALHKPLQQMYQQVVRMENLLRDLLWLARLESAPQQGQAFTRIDVAALLEDVAQAGRELSGEREIVLELHSQQPLRGDYQQLYSAVSNLLGNALKYSTGPVRLSWRERAQELCLAVRDEGVGIARPHLPRLTERFYRVEPSRAQQSGGTGLGLAIVKHVLAAHGAHLVIDSEPGVGSTFSCVFPRPV